MKAPVAFVLTLMALAAPVAAQQADTSIAARLEKAERMIEILRQQVAEQAKTRVEPREGNRVQLGGTVLMNGFYNNAKVNSSDLPTFVLPRDPPGGLPISALGGTARQTELTLGVSVPDVIGAAFTGELEADFYGGQLAFARLFPLLHLKRTRAELRWPHAWIMFGEDAPPIASVNPSSFAARSIPGFTNAGNLWLWIPQFRAGVEGGSGLRLGIEGAALAPISMENPTIFQPEPSRAERSRLPSAEARVLARWDHPRGSGEVSIGAHYGRFATAIPNSVITSKAVAASARISAGGLVEVRAEAFLGQALASLGGGGIGQDIGPGDRPVRTRGGWAQLNLTPHPAVEIGGGFGFDDPDEDDLDVSTARLLNVSWEGHLHLKPAPVLLALEFRRVETTYGVLRGGKLFVNHLNLGAGFRF